MNVRKLCHQALERGAGRILVSPKMYMTIASNAEPSYAGFVARPATSEGFLARIHGVEIHVNNHVPDGSVALFAENKFVGIVEVENEPAQPADPYLRVRQIVRDRERPDVWLAYDESGEFLMHLSESGARKLAARRNLGLRI